MRDAGILFLGLACALLLTAQEATAPCIPASVEKSCRSCHPGDGARWESRRSRPCSKYCLSCHAPKEMEKHHPVGGKLPATPPPGLLLTGEGTTGCSTCHDLGKPRFDKVRWRSESLYDRLFRRQPRYRTYFLAVRNDRGQLCKACH
jgi:hypothetical protein